MREIKLPYFFDMLTETIRQHIIDFIAELNPEVFVVELDLRKGKINRLILRIDTDEGINMSVCGDVNRAVGRWLDENDTLPFEYAMEVSSPGIGEPLILKRQYHKNVGRDLRVILKAGGESQGKLTGLEEEAIKITPYVQNKHLKKGQKPKLSDTEKIILFDSIKESRVII